MYSLMDPLVRTTPSASTPVRPYGLGAPSSHHSQQSGEKRKSLFSYATPQAMCSKYSLRTDSNKRLRSTKVLSLGSRICNAPDLPDSPALDQPSDKMQLPPRSSPVVRMAQARNRRMQMALFPPSVPNFVFDPTISSPTPSDQPSLTRSSNGDSSPEESDRGARHYLPNLDADTHSDQQQGITLSLRQCTSSHLFLP